jgi:hypothetical protein
MSDHEEFEDLQAIAERAKKRATDAGLIAPPLPPVERFDKDRLLASLPVGIDTGEFERSQRVAEALAVRDMLPPFLRSPKRETLESRVVEKDFLRAVMGWRWGQGNLLLLGQTGSGKSTAVAILYRALLAHGVRHGGQAWENARFMAWFGAAELAEAAKEHPFGKGEAPETRHACRARLLVLDDAGLDTDPAVCSLVLDERYQCERPTIITSGRSEAELIAHYGAAFVRRMTEPRGAIMARFPEAAAHAG